MFKLPMTLAFMYFFCMHLYATSENEHLFFMSKKLGITENNLTPHTYGEILKRQVQKDSIFNIIYENYIYEFILDSIFLIKLQNGLISVNSGNQTEASQNAIKEMKKNIELRISTNYNVKTQKINFLKKTFKNIYNSIFQNLNQNYSNKVKKDIIDFEISNNKLFEYCVEYCILLEQANFNYYFMLSMILEKYGNKSYIGLVMYYETFLQAKFSSFKTLENRISDNSNNLVQLKVQNHLCNKNLQHFTDFINKYFYNNCLKNEIELKNYIKTIQSEACQNTYINSFAHFFDANFFLECYRKYNFLFDYITNNLKLIIEAFNIDDTDQNYNAMFLNVTQIRKRVTINFLIINKFIIEHKKIRFNGSEYTKEDKHTIMKYIYERINENNFDIKCLFEMFNHFTCAIDPESKQYNVNPYKRKTENPISQIPNKIRHTSNTNSI